MVPSMLGDSQTRVPAGWKTGLGDSAARGRAPLAVGTRKRCKCTSLGNTRSERIAALYATRQFSVDKELSKLRLLRIRARFHDGIIVYINGREVVRRNVTDETTPHTAAGINLANQAHGPEWETFYVSVVAGLLRPGANILAVEVRPGKGRLSPSLDVELSGSTGPRVVRGPMVQRVAEDSAVLVFETDLPTRAYVEYGQTASLGQRITSAAGGLAVHHSVTLTSLAKQKPVHYRLVVDGEPTPSYRFHTAPRAGDPLRFVVYGDVRGGHRVHQRIVGAILREAPDFVLATGDLVLRGSDEADWQKFFSIARQLLSGVPYYPVAGNHDMGRAGDERRRMNEMFALWPGPSDRPAAGHWYSFDVGGVHFVMLDSNAYGAAKQLRWLERDLAAARRRKVRAIFATAHDGPYSRGLHRGNRKAAQLYAPLLARYKVTMLFSGHDHLYQRGVVKGLPYIVSGGGGAPLYNISCGVRGRPRCRNRDGMKKVKRAHHFVVVDVYRDQARVCAKRPDGTLLEKCQSYKLR